MKKVVILTGILLIVLVTASILNRSEAPSLSPTSTPNEVPSDIIDHISSKSDLIVVSEPQPLSTVTSSLTVKGEARGMWFFEATFPVILVDWDGRIIAESYATAVLDPDNPESTWMTEDFVPFEGTIEFEIPENVGEFSSRGAIIFQKDNPSGLPENDDALEIPVLFEN